MTIESIEDAVFHVRSMEIDDLLRYGIIKDSEVEVLARRMWENRKQFRAAFLAEHEEWVKIMREKSPGRTFPVAVAS